MDKPKLMDIKDTYKLHIKVGRKIIDKCISTCLERTTAIYKASDPKCHVKIIGRRTTYKAAQLWINKGGNRSYFKKDTSQLKERK